MSTFEIQPHEREAVVAVGAVQAASKKDYPHYIKVFGKLSPKGVVTLSYISTTTSLEKAIEDHYLTPQSWLEQQRKSASNRFLQEKEKLCS